MRENLAKPVVQLIVVIDAFIVGLLAARAFGAEWGIAAGIGQITFAATLVTVMLAAPRPQ